MRLKFQYLTLYYNAIGPKFQGDGNVGINLLYAVCSATVMTREREPEQHLLFTKAWINDLMRAQLEPLSAKIGMMVGDATVKLVA